MPNKTKDLFTVSFLFLMSSIANSETASETKTFTSPSIIIGEADDFFDDKQGDEDPEIDVAADWDHMISGSFGYSADQQNTNSQNETERILDIMPPNESNNRLIDESSLPLLAAFGNPKMVADHWPRGKTYQTGQLPAARFYDLKGCKFNLKTGPISVAHYYKVNAEYELRSDSVVPMTVIEPEAKGFNLYVAANADIYPELDLKTLEICTQNLKGKIIPIGRFNLSASTITLGETHLNHKISVVSKEPAKSVQVYLYWPTGRTDPLLIDDSGLYPLLSTPIFEIKAEVAGSSFLEVIPYLTYVKGGKALSPAKLKSFWGE